VIPAGGGLVMPWSYSLVRDIILVLFGGGLLWLLFNQRSFLKERIRILEGSQQALVNEANSLRARMDPLLALFDRLSPEKLVMGDVGSKTT